MCRCQPERLRLPGVTVPVGLAAAAGGQAG